jgi:hypothetical protein
LLKHKPAFEFPLQRNLETVIIWIMAPCILYVVINIMGEPAVSVVWEEINSDCIRVGLHNLTTSNRVGNDGGEEQRSY